MIGIEREINIRMDSSDAEALRRETAFYNHKLEAVRQLALETKRLGPSATSITLLAENVLRVLYSRHCPGDEEVYDEEKRKDEK